MLCRTVHDLQPEVAQEPTKQQGNHSQTTRQLSSSRMPTNDKQEYAEISENVAVLHILRTPPELL